jgi:hypothetical protein
MRVTVGATRSCASAGGKPSRITREDPRSDFGSYVRPLVNQRSSIDSEIGTILIVCFYSEIRKATKPVKLARTAEGRMPTTGSGSSMRAGPTPSTFPRRGEGLDWARTFELFPILERRDSVHQAASTAHYADRIDRDHELPTVQARRRFRDGFEVGVVHERDSHRH